MTTSRVFKPNAIHALAGVEPTLQPDDLNVLGEVVARAKIVALGEPTHGQKEINQLRDRITRYLIEHEGFRAVAMEDSAIKCRLVNDYILHGKGSAQNALRQQNFWTWRTREVLAMIEWFRNWNVNHPEDTVRFIGVDIQDLRSPTTELFAVLARIDIEVATRFNPSLTRIGAIQIWNDEQFDAVAYSDYQATLSKIREFIEMTGDVTSEDRDLGLDCVLALEQALKLWRATATSGNESSAERWNRRDDVMATRALAPTLVGRQVVLWAHNAHVQSDKMVGLPNGAVTMGQVLREHLSNEYCVISGVFGQGGYRGYDESMGTLGTLDVGDPPPGTLDYELWKLTDSPALLVYLDSPASILFEHQSTRWAGASLVPGSEMVTWTRPALGSNALVFVRKASPSQLL